MRLQDRDLKKFTQILIFLFEICQMKMIFNDFFNKYRTELDTYIPKYIYEYALALFRLMRDVRLEMLESVPPQALISAS